METVVGRLAPSPSGEMHLGNAFSALLAWLGARSAGGRVLLRLEDLDRPRCPAKYAYGVMEDLAWLGLDWDNDPVWQSQRDDFYAQQIQALADQGLVYPCYCSRKELHAVTEASAPHGRAPVYTGRCRDLTAAQREALEAQGRRPALRARAPERVYGLTDGLQGPFAADLAREVGDFILRRSDGLYAYQLAVVADDGAMGVNQVVRGRDLLASTPQQLWLQEALGLPHPAYYHVPLLLAPDGRRLSKREGDLSLRALGRDHRPEEIVGRLAFWAGLQPEPRPVTPQALLPRFSWDKVRREDIPAAL